MKFIVVKVGEANISGDLNKFNIVLFYVINDFGRQAVRDIKMYKLFFIDLAIQKVVV